MWRLLGAGFIGACCWWSSVLAGAAENDAELERQLAPLIAVHRGRVAVAIRQLDGEHAEFRFADQQVMPTASLIKLPVMIETYRQARAGKVDLNRSLSLRDDDKVPGSGILTTHFSAGASLSLRDAVRLMIAFSDNTATNLVLNEIGLPSTAATMEQMGLPDTKIHSLVFRRDTSIFPDRSQKYGLGSTTAADMVTLLEQLHDGSLIDADACREMRAHLLACDDKKKLPRFLPDGIQLAHKTGSVSDVRTDAGLLMLPNTTVAMCVLTAGNDDRSWGQENGAEILCGRVGEIVYRRFAPPSAAASASTPLTQGASGKLVEDLQRTLNARLKPSPELSVDGEYGPMTASAVRRWQREHNLTESGEVAPETWASLGALVTEERPVPAPQEVNAEALPREPAEDLDGPPIVTCRAWALADAGTGEILWQSSADQRLEIASTTKIMTAYLVLQMAQEQPAILDETVTFSQRADQTGGSAAAIREGEQVSVRELLYGLLLPSGNDAAVALAEHFGARCAGDSEDALLRFVAEMNRRAKALDMQDTTYANPHGLPQRDHVSSARDLIRLTRAALEIPLFCEIVATRQHGCEVAGREGYRRNVVWRNTNQLLARDGYDGVKTGTTEAAGACLVSRGQRGDRALLCVVLGSAASPARYADTRNLFRWAFRTLESAP